MSEPKLTPERLREIANADPTLEISGYYSEGLRTVIRSAADSLAEEYQKREHRDAVIKQLVEALRDADESCRKLLNGDRYPAELDPQSWHQALAAAEALERK